MYGLSSLWEIVERIVKKRGRILTRYSYAEDFWRVFERYPVIVLEAPPGAGKTEVTHAPALAQLELDKRSFLGLYHVLPTRSLVETMFKRVCKELKVLGLRKVIPTLDHGSSPLKPFLEGDFVVTTYDTLFYTAYGFRRRGYHILFPLMKVSGSWLILDEVQLLQDTFWYALSILPYHVHFLRNYGAKIVLMSATFPSILRDEIKTMLEDRLGEEVGFVVSSDRPLRGNLEVMLKTESALELVEKRYHEFEKPLLVVVNTVSDAAILYQKLRSLGQEPILLHGRLRQIIRRTRERFFEGDFPNDNVTVIATQVVEAGLDYDFRTVVTDLAPVDSLIQRVGRGARRKEGTAYVCDISEEGLLRACRVYPRSICELTLEVINDVNLSEAVKSVNCARRLVDNVYTESVVEALRTPQSDVLEKIKGLTQKMTRTSEILGIREKFEEVAQSLLRLGQELRCVVFDKHTYEKLLREVGGRRFPCKTSLLTLDDLEENSLPVSIRPFGRTLGFLLHEISGKCTYVEMVPAGDVVELRLKPKLYAKEQKSYFLLNPNFYECDKSRDNYDIGLVRLYYDSGV